MPSCAELRNIFMLSMNQLSKSFVTTVHPNNRINPFAFAARSPAPNNAVRVDSSPSQPPASSSTPFNKRLRPATDTSSLSNTVTLTDPNPAPNRITSTNDFHASKRKLMPHLKNPEARNFGKFYSASSDDEIRDRPDRSLDVIDESPAFYFARPVSSAKLSDFWSEGTWHAPTDKLFYPLRT
jgi:hypothetical protein